MAVKPKIEILNYDFTIHQLKCDEKIPAEIFGTGYFWIGRTKEELSIVCESSIDIRSSKRDSNWIALKLIGPFDFSEIGILSDISGILAGNRISIFALSTYNTDYILVKKNNLENAIQVLLQSGYYIPKIV